MQPDPLAPVDATERILRLVASNGPVWLGGAALAGIALFAPFAQSLGDRRTASLGLAAALYLATSFAVTFVGNFPVPIFGAGAGPVLGWYAWLALALDQSR